MLHAALLPACSLASPAQPPPGLLWAQQGRSHVAIWGLSGDISALSPSVSLNGSSKNSLKTSWLFPTHWGSFPLSLSALTPYKSQHLRIATDKRFLMPQTLHTVFLERGFHGSLQFAAILLDNAGTTGKGLKQSRL